MDSNQRHDPQTSRTSMSDDPADILTRLKALKADPTPADVDGAQSRRWQIGLIVGGTGLTVAIAIFFVVTAWRLHGQNATTLDDGWTRVTDRQWGFEVDFPTWYTKTSDGHNQDRYQSRFENNTPIRLRVQKWPQKKLNKSTPAEELASIISRERSLRPVEILIDRSTESISPMIEFASTCGQPGADWTVRERVIIHKGVMVRIDIVEPERVSPKELDRFLNSVRWLP